MAKIKPPTAQELYWAKKKRDEDEKSAYLPPGLVNHGNTCFMNSVLQGLIATQLLSDLAHFNSIPPEVQNYSSTPLLPQRSPQLTNGHEIGGEFERKWEDTMPLGDVFFGVMHRAWDIQSNRQRQSLSPRGILNLLGRKHDQYLDFAQQDAHEFLRILLDSMRMEEFDVIKKRQPPPPPKSTKRKRRTTITPSSLDKSDTPAPEIPEEQKLMSIVDMIFGGKLTSLLVCQKCKHVSHTYEEFNDLSLSIKAEDYVRERKRDRFKNLAKKLTNFPGSPSLGVATHLSTSHRSSSVPPSPGPRDRGPLEYPEGDLSVSVDEPRRRSFDGSRELMVDDGGDNESVNQLAASGTLSGATTPDDKRVEFSTPEKPARDAGRSKKGNSDWAKIGRRISLTMGLKKPLKDPSERKGRSRERKSLESLPQDSSVQSTPRASISDSSSIPSTVDLRKELHPDIADNLYEEPTKPRSRPISLQHRSTSPAIPLLSPNHSPTKLPLPVLRGKSPRPPKPTPAQAEYLRQILADVVPASSAHPFNLFKPSGTTSQPSNPVQNFIKPIGQLSGVEECLRMFTAVEILDGENMVGCRRCWKIANGVYSPDATKDVLEADDDDEDEDEVEDDGVKRKSASAPAIPGADVSLPHSMSTPSISIFSHSNLSSDSASIISLPTTVATSISDPVIHRKHEDESYAASGHKTLPTSRQADVSKELPSLPNGHQSIDADYVHVDLSEVAEQRPEYVPHPHTHLNDTPQIHITPSESILTAPRHRQRRQYGSDFDNTDESSGSGGESDVSASQSGYSSASSVGTSPLGPSTGVRDDGQLLTPKVKSKPKPKPVIMRPAYKRYLIATPPPTLVIHFKRFQQISSKSMISFSNGFKKLEDTIAFPEFLDLTPFLAPKKEDFGLKKGTGKTLEPQSTDVKRCMYRLYGVVVHIGSMLGGHYIAYTALPNSGEGGERQWAYISDTVVKLTTKEEVLKSKAYICMYERI